MFNRSRVALLCVAVVTLSGRAMVAQSDLGSIQGVVKDPSASSVPNATVTVKNDAGLDRST